MTMLLTADEANRANDAELEYAGDHCLRYPCHSHRQCHLQSSPSLHTVPSQCAVGLGYTNFTD